MTNKIKKSLAAAFLLGVMAIGSTPTLADDGIIVGGRDGIIVGGRDGIIVGGRVCTPSFDLLTVAKVLTSITLDRTGLLLSDRTGLLISDRNGCQ